MDYLLFTGHDDGKILAWQNPHVMPAFQRIVKEYKYPVVQMEFLDTEICVATDDAIIYVWDCRMEDCLKSLDLSHLPFRLQSLKIKNVVWAKEKILIATYSGDLVQLNPELKKELIKGSFIYSIDGKRFRNIFKLNKTLTSSLMIRKKDVVKFDVGLR